MTFIETINPLRSVFPFVARPWRALLLFLSVGLSAGCADKVTSATNGCPCATGNVCCTSGVCAASESACPAATLALAQESAGNWIGYFENFSLPSGSDAVKISLSVSGEQAIAQFTVGSPSVVPAPIGSNADGGFFFDGGGAPGFELREGYVYEAKDLRWESRRLKFNVSMGEPWKSRCESYPPVTFKGETFFCPSDWGFNGQDGSCTYTTKAGESVPIDCKLLQGCYVEHCSCNENACTVSDAVASIDVALRGDIADGSAGGLGGAGPINIRLTRSSP